MGTATLGRTTVAVKLENLQDSLESSQGRRPSQAVRTLEIPDALVDTGARMLSVPLHLIQQLGLQKFDTREAITGNGKPSFDLYSAVRLTIDGRQCVLDVAALPDDCPVVIGYIPLEQLDFIVDPIQQKVVGNPRHNGKFMIDMF